MLVHYQSHLIVTELFPEDVHRFRFNPITRKCHISFVNRPATIALIRSTGNMTATPPSNTGLEYNFKVACSLDYSFKKNIERYEIIFTTFREIKY